MIKSTSSDRLSFTLVISIIIHLIILLGVSFNVFSPPTNSAVNNLEITLVKKQDRLQPEQTDFLAQANNEGGGEFTEPSPNPSPDKPTQVADKASQPSPPQPQALNIDQPITSLSDHPADNSLQNPDNPQPKEKVKAVTQTQSKHKIKQVNKPGETADNKADPKLSARELMLQAQNQIQRMEEELQQIKESSSNSPRKRVISAATKEYAPAAYVKAWELKVERIGNMNYPQEAKRQGLNGSLKLSVDINPDGSVPPGGIVISRSSGHKILDDAAVKIVRLGAPYSAIPKEVLQSYDMLTITRIWKFESDRGLSTQ